MSVVSICYAVMVRMMGSAVVFVFSVSCAAPAAFVETSNDRPLTDLPLARFMREEVNVPFSFVMIETATAQRERRVRRAASVLRAAAHDLVQWNDPPVVSIEGRDVFYAYAENLEHHVTRLEDAAARSEVGLALDSVEQIRQTCNSCHRFFRPANVISSDVAYDWYAFDLGGLP